jgi:hypothetical protein
VAHFGDGFDLKWIKGRALKHRIAMFPKYRSIDTCKIARKNFYLNSAKLDYLAQYLGIGSKLKTEPGLWRRVMLDKCAKSLEFMCRYNREDVLLLEKVFHRIESYSPHSTHVGVLHGGEKWSCPKCASGNVKTSKTKVSAAGTKSFQMQCLTDGGYYTISQSAHNKYTEEKIRLKLEEEQKANEDKKKTHKGKR